MDDLVINVKEENEFYTKEEWENQYGLDPGSFINDDVIIL